MADLRIERALIGKGFKRVAGLDEVGRGALFGPVVAAAVIFPVDLINQTGKFDWLDEVDDSKRLSAVKRERLSKKILFFASSAGIGLATHKEIDHKNIAWASQEAMRRALTSMTKNPDFLLVDGFLLNNVNYSQKKVVQGDRKSITIAAASIIAKVFRDEMLNHFDAVFEGYNLSKNKGYGTKEHYQALEKMGPSIFHRHSFNLRGNN